LSATSAPWRAGWSAARSVQLANDVHSSRIWSLGSIVRRATFAYFAGIAPLICWRLDDWLGLPPRPLIPRRRASAVEAVDHPTIDPAAEARV
jgi:hypothetical protein